MDTMRHHEGCWMLDGCASCHAVPGERCEDGCPEGGELPCECDQ